MVTVMLPPFFSLPMKSALISPSARHSPGVADDVFHARRLAVVDLDLHAGLDKRDRRNCDLQKLLVAALDDEQLSDRLAGGGKPFAARVTFLVVVDLPANLLPFRLRNGRRRGRRRSWCRRGSFCGGRRLILRLPGSTGKRDERRRCRDPYGDRNRACPLTRRISSETSSMPTRPAGGAPFSRPRLTAKLGDRVTRPVLIPVICERRQFIAECCRILLPGLAPT